MSQRILIVEDQAENRIVLRHILQKADYITLEAEDGPTGLQMARQEKPDVIVCDIGLPGISGFDILKALTAAPDTKDIPVIFLTAREDDESMRQAMRMGATNFLTKPVTPAELLEAVEDVLSGEVADLVED